MQTERFGLSLRKPHWVTGNQPLVIGPVITVELSICETAIPKKRKASLVPPTDLRAHRRLRGPLERRCGYLQHRHEKGDG
jgi:hypothetical protein